MESAILRQLIESMDSLVNRLEDAVIRNNIEESNNLKQQILELKKRIDKEAA